MLGSEELRVLDQGLGGILSELAARADFTGKQVGPDLLHGFT